MDKCYIPPSTVKSLVIPNPLSIPQYESADKWKTSGIIRLNKHKSKSLPTSPSNNVQWACGMGFTARY